MYSVYVQCAMYDNYYYYTCTCMHNNYVIQCQPCCVSSLPPLGPPLDPRHHPPHYWPNMGYEGPMEHPMPRGPPVGHPMPPSQPSPGPMPPHHPGPGPGLIPPGGPPPMHDSRFRPVPFRPNTPSSPSPASLHSMSPATKH